MNWKDLNQRNVRKKKEEELADKIIKTDKEWKNELTPEQYNVCRKKDTEIPFTGIYWDCKDKGIYRCSCCYAELFDSKTKFDSGTGWPSFFEPIISDNIECVNDTSGGMLRIEVNCGKCGAHLGHVFDDGPQPTNLRYCINSISLHLDKLD
ncbi:Peptide methionine sulfoxide reductase MsrB protein [Marine Group I thaumarchaeote SCGC AAA799-O18]|nr:Peptide methionine sulfoxide reductase MsrB protein [Marine Group I thaumarchaeote SCGC AAA799-O18]